jgi:hypothetical protein
MRKTKQIEELRWILKEVYFGDYTRPHFRIELRDFINRGVDNKINLTPANLAGECEFYKNAIDQALDGLDLPIPYGHHAASMVWNKDLDCYERKDNPGPESTGTVSRRRVILLLGSVGHLLKRCKAPKSRNTSPCGKVFVASKRTDLYCGKKCLRRIVRRRARAKAKEAKQALGSAKAKANAKGRGKVAVHRKQGSKRRA